MLVDREKILKAKKKLGINNAHIIAEELEIQGYDSKNLKACCPYHDEQTASFIFNPKSYSFHCFGCNKTVDIIDVYMQKGMTYLQAVQKLFELANIQYSFGEVGVQTQRQYRYPHEEPLNDKEKVYEYMEMRGISRGTVDYLDIRQDAKGNIVFNYYDDNDCLTMVKYRPARRVQKGEAKNWCQPGADTTPLLFNMNRINVTQPLLICCGESDCAAAIEAGWTNAVSIPLGDGNTHWIERCWDWLEQFESIILCADNDEPGQKFLTEVRFRLGSWRCKIVNLPPIYPMEDHDHHIKDLNECLYFFGKDIVMDCIMNASDSPIDSLIDFADVEDLDLDDIDGIYTGINQLDKELMRMFFGTLTVLTGTPGSGKTSFLFQLICDCLDQERNAWVFSRELPAYMSRNWINYLLAGPRWVNTYLSSNGTEYYKVADDVKRKIGEYYRGKMHLYKDGWKNDLDSLKESMIGAARKYGSKLYILDNLTTIDLHANDENKYDKQTEFINWLIEFAASYNVCVILVVHPRKVENPNASLSKYDIGGSSNIINLAHRSIGLRRVTKKEAENGNQYSVMVSVIKDRLRGREGFELGMYYDIPSRRFFTSPEEYDHRYLWDDSEHVKPIAYPIPDDPTDEVFGKVGSQC